MQLPRGGNDVCASFGGTYSVLGMVLGRKGIVGSKEELEYNGLLKLCNKTP